MTGMFVEQTQLTSKQMKKIFDLDDVKLIADKLKTNCRVCALGACLLSVVSLQNDFVFELQQGNVVGVESYDLADRLLKVFTAEQLLLIETAFECENFTGYFTGNYDELHMGSMTRYSRRLTHQLEIAKALGERFNDSKKRLRAIMRNMIANNGKFIPA